MIDGVGIFLGILLDASALHVLQLHHVGQFVGVNAVRVVDVAVGIRQRQHRGTQLDALLGSILCHITRTGDQHLLALQFNAACLQHGVQEIDRAVACGLGANQ